MGQENECGLEAEECGANPRGIERSQRFIGHMRLPAEPIAGGTQLGESGLAAAGIAPEGDGNIDDPVSALPHESQRKKPGDALIIGVRRKQKNGRPLPSRLRTTGKGDRACIPRRGSQGLDKREKRIHGTHLSKMLRWTQKNKDEFFKTFLKIS
jgi:hypothetical protein